MKTISFYSYKGGVGRTLLAAHVARYLAGLGKKVVLVDFDFDAPGVPAIFGLNAFKDIRGGILDLVLEFRAESHLSPQFRRRLNQYLIPPKFKVPSLRKDRRGWLKILPSGHSRTEQYWETISSVTWFGALSVEQVPNPIVRFVNHFLKPAVEDLGADYLLVDSRAGVTHYGGIAKRIADREAIIFCPNDESKHALEYLSAGLRKLQTRRVAENKERALLHLPVTDDPELSFTLVISRIPPELKETKAKLAEWRSWLKSQFGKIRGFKGILPLHSDLHTHLDQQLRFPRSDTPTNVVQLHEDIVLILVTMFPEMVPDSAEGKPAEKKAHAFWQFAFQRPFEITYINRLFGLLNDRGEILNPDDSERNVAFKVDTFLRFLNNFYDGLERELGNHLPAMKRRQRKELTQSRIDRTLMEAGNQCGTAFGKELAKKLLGTKAPQDKIKRWCEFDTRAGFGRMTFDSVGTLVVENVFLQKPKITRHRNYTAFFAGYAGSVLLEILKPRVLTFFEKKSISRSKIIYELKYR